MEWVLLVAFIIVIYKVSIDTLDFGYWIVSSILGLSLVGLIWTFLLCAGQFISYRTSTETVKREYSLVSLQDGSGFSIKGQGRSFLFSGYMTIDGNTYKAYSGYIKQGNAYKLKEWNADIALVRIDDKNPRVIEEKEIKYRACKDTWYAKFFICRDTKKFQTSITDVEYNLYIPSGSIVEEFNLDSK